MNRNLHAVIPIKTMARAAIPAKEVFTAEAGEQMANAYARLREEARELSERAGWATG